VKLAGYGRLDVKLAGYGRLDVKLSRHHGRLWPARCG
jgi:hypothetical protein